MKFFPKKLSLKWINQAYDNNELTPYELVDEILKRAEESSLCQGLRQAIMTASLCRTRNLRKFQFRQRERSECLMNR